MKSPLVHINGTTVRESGGMGISSSLLIINGTVVGDVKIGCKKLPCAQWLLVHFCAQWQFVQVFLSKPILQYFIT